MEASEHVFTVNPAGAFTHAEFDGDRPLCGWIKEAEAVSPDWAEVTCLDCQAARAG